MYPKRLEIIKDYDFMAAMGPAIKRRIITEGVEPDKLLNIGIARTDEVMQKLADKEKVRHQLLLALGLEEGSKLIAYLPTFWGPSSIYTTGKEIIKNCPSDYTLLFRPHPQTPKKLLAEYSELIGQKNNVFYVPEHGLENLGLLDVLASSEVIIGDVSSVMLEAILLDIPLIFAFDEAEHRQTDTDYSLIKNIVSHSQKVDLQSAHLLPAIIERALVAGVDQEVWNMTKDQVFYNHDGTSVAAISHTITRLAGL
jgi:CDP-glycerol glycerophosphotransferase (TagB/SpsB family)